MKKSFIATILGALSLMSLAGAQVALPAAASGAVPGVGAQEGISGSTEPMSALTFDLSQARSGYTAFSLQAGKDLTQNLRGFGISFGGPGNPDIDEVHKYMRAEWTKGQIVNFSGARYLVAYRFDIPNGNMVPEDANAPGWTKEAMAFLAHPVYGMVLVNVTDVNLIRPLTDLTPENFAKLKSKIPPLPEGKELELSNLKKVAEATLMYCDDSDDVLPYADSTAEASREISPYLRSLTILKSVNPNGGGFLYIVKVSGTAITMYPDLSIIPVWYDSVAWPDGTRFVAFLDGHVKRVSAEEWSVLFPLTQNRPKFARRKPDKPPKTRPTSPRT